MFHCRIDKAESNIHISVVVKAIGWAGVGLSEVGVMKGADVV